MKIETQDADAQAYLVHSPKQQAALETAFSEALKYIGCVECARIDCIQRLRFIACEKNDEIMGNDWQTAAFMDQEPPIERDGIRRICDQCQNPPPEGSVQFFKHGTDRFIGEK